MQVSLNWLKKYTAIDLPLDELVTRIGSQLGAVEQVIDQRAMHNDIRIVQITEAKPHPNADKLNIYRMTDGKQEVQVVSGDRTLEVGDKVAWLAPGTTIPATYGTAAPVVLEARPMRGEMSYGMFGSGKELAMNDDHEHVLVLDTDAKAGTLLAEAYELDDVIIDIENKMFTHRPDCFGLLGVAREIAGIGQQAFTSPDWYLLAAGKFMQPTAEVLPLTVKNEIPNLCPHYEAVTMRDVRIAPSPLLFQSYLKRVGIRPISNVVDVTNYLMYLTGQPLHAFDYDKVAAIDGQRHAGITVRTPRKDETITLLDGRTITPHAEAILICTRHKPIAIGGVMGGAEAEVDDCTENIIIEAANFNMYSIRKTSMEHGIFTDAVTRYSKGQSIAQCGAVLAEAVTLMDRYAAGKLSSELGVEKPQSPDSVVLTSQFITDRLGAPMQPSYIKRLLENVELHVEMTEEELTITPGFWRTDLEIPEDIVEEVGRLHGYSSLPHTLPLRTTEAVSLPSSEAFKAQVRTVLAKAGNNELQTYSFIAAKLLEKTGQETKPAYRLRNAISPELELIRTGLLPSLLEKVHPNHKAGYDQFGLFEIGKSHTRYELGDDGLPRERLGLSYLFSVEQKSSKEWAGAPYYQARYMLSYLFDELHIPVQTVPLLDASLDVWWLQNLVTIFEPKRAALIVSSGIVLGIAGEFNASVRRNFKLPEFIAGFELDLGAAHGIARPESVYLPLLRFPATEQDVCFRVKNEVTYEQLADVIREHFVSDERLRVQLKPVDIYHREADATHKRITYRIILQHHDRTLTTDEVNKHLVQLAARANELYGAERI